MKEQEIIQNNQSAEGLANLWYLDDLYDEDLGGFVDENYMHIHTILQEGFEVVEVTSPSFSELNSVIQTELLSSGVYGEGDHIIWVTAKNTSQGNGHGLTPSAFYAYGAQYGTIVLFDESSSRIKKIKRTKKAISDIKTKKA